MEKLYNAEKVEATRPLQELRINKLNQTISKNPPTWKHLVSLYIYIYRLIYVCLCVYIYVQFIFLSHSGTMLGNH